MSNHLFPSFQHHDSMGNVFSRPEALKGTPSTECQYQPQPQPPGEVKTRQYRYRHRPEGFESEHHDLIYRSGGILE
jgi:hypothetical protein